jgi:chemotaxis family two-component system sensor kinase Cph1
MRTELSEDYRNVSPGRHLCLFHDDDSDWRRGIVPCVHAALDMNHKCLYIAHTTTQYEIIRTLSTSEYDLNKYLASGQFQIFYSDYFYAPDGKFDPDKIIKLAIQSNEQALSEGYSGLWIAGEANWTFQNPEHVGCLLEYESRLNSELFNRYNCTAICVYDMTKFNAPVLKEVLKTHPEIIYKGNILENYYYLTTEKYLNASKTQYELAQNLRHLNKMAMIKRNIEDTENQLKTFVELGAEAGEYLLILQDINGEEGVITYASENFLRWTGYAEAEVIGALFFNFLLEEDKPEALSRHRRKMKGAALPRVYEINFTCKDGRVLPVELCSGVTRYKGARVNAVYLKDVSEKKLMEIKLLEVRAQAKATQKSKQLMAEFQAMVSHEIRTPLAAIKGFASTLLQPDVSWSKKEMLDFIKEIDASAERLSNIANDLLEITRLDEKKKGEEKSYQSLTNILEEAKPSLQEVAGEHQLIMKIPPPPQACHQF